MTWIEELEAKRAKATGGKWRQDARHIYSTRGTLATVGDVYDFLEAVANADYIVTLVNAAPRLLALARLAEEAREVMVTASAAHTYGSYRGVPDLRRDAEKWLMRFAAATSPDVPRRPDSNAK